MENKVDVYQVIKSIITYLHNSQDIYMVSDNPHFPLARAVLLDTQIGTALRGQLATEVV